MARIMMLAFVALISFSLAMAQTPAIWVDKVMSVGSVIGGETQWSPDGLKIMFVSNLGGSPGLWSVSSSGGFPTKLAQDIGGVPFQLSRHPRWSPNGKWISYISDKGSADGAPDIWLWSVSGGYGTRLTKMEARIGSTCWSPDAEWIAFSSGLNGNQDIWKVSVPDGKTVRLTADPRYEIEPIWSPDSKKIYYVAVDDAWRDHDLMVMDSTGVDTKLVARDTDFFDYGTSGTPAFGPPLVSPDGTKVLFPSWRSGWINYWIVASSGGEARNLSPEQCDQSGASWAPDGKQIAFLSNYNGTRKLRLVTAQGGESRLLVEPNMGVVADAEWSPDGKRVSYVLQTPTTASDLYIVDMETGKSKQLTFSSPGGNMEKELVTPEKITYPSDGLTISAYLYKPKKVDPGKKLPGIVFAHGGPTGQYSDTYEMQMQFFAGQGYVVLAPNFRGSSGYGRKFADLNNKCWAHCDLADLVAGVEHLKTLSYVDTNRMGITGTSHGGLLSMAAATFAPGVFKASIPHGGTADRIYYYKTQELRHIKQADNEFGPLEKNEEVYRYVSPFYFVKDVNTPMFVIWGEGRWPSSQNSKNYVAELERYYKPHRAKVYYNENYYVSGRANVRQMMLDMLEFFDQYLKGEENRQ